MPVPNLLPAPLWATLCAFVLSLGLALAAAAQPLTAAGDDAAAPPEPAPEPVPAYLQSPRAAMTTFLEAMNAIKDGEAEAMDRALETLDLSRVNPLVRREKGSELAWTLLEVLDRTRVVEPARISDEPDGEPYVFEEYPQGPVVIARGDDGRWQFNAATLDRATAILDGLGDRAKVTGEDSEAFLPFHLRLRQAIPAELKSPGFILELWQWLAILAVILVGVVADKGASLLLTFLVRRWKGRFRDDAFQQLDERILRPLGLMVMAAIWWAGLNLLGLPADVLLVLLVAVKFLASLSGVWGAYRLVDLVKVYMLQRALKTRSRLDDALVPMMTRALKLFVTVIGIVFVADNLNIDVSSLLAGLGLGGLAFALAAKDVAGNFFGSITVLADRTFSVGDWVVIGDIEGTVEDIGFRSTRIRTFYNSLVTVPNSQLITASVDNMGKRRFRRYRAHLDIAYDTPPERIEAFCEGIRELVRLHPYMRKDYYHVYFNDYGPSSLRILVYVFWSTPDWGTELRERHRFLLDCLRLARRLGVEFAYPTQTIQWKRSGASPPVPEAGGFAPAVDQDEALIQGREAARGIVEHTSGLDSRPPPVRFT
jgi:MscS family membrane protein